MADKSKIEWTEATWNPITGCSIVSPGCTNCYAMKLAGGRLQHHPSRAGLTKPSKAGPVWTGEVRFNEKWLDQPLRWKRPRMIFVCAHADLFHEGVPDEWIDKIFAVMALAPQHTFQVLTKRSARMREYMGAERYDEINSHAGVLMDWSDMPQLECGPLPNVWLGISAEDQKRADERIPDLLATPAAVRWISAEPLLGSIDLWAWGYDAIEGWVVEPECCGRPDNTYGEGSDGYPIVTGEECCGSPDPVQVQTERIDWIVAGGESGHGARPCHPDWIRGLRDRCAANDVAFFFKQWGAWAPIEEWLPGPSRQLAIMLDGSQVPFDDPPQDVGGQRFKHVGKKAAGRTLDGRTHDDYPKAHNGED